MARRTMELKNFIVYEVGDGKVGCGRSREDSKSLGLHHPLE
jgi:hypothetical protein